MKLIVFLALCIAVVAAKRCKSAEDCEEGECCVNYVIVTLFGGHCHKLRDEGESCTPLTKTTDETPAMYHFQCPCKEGLDCVATHEIKVGEHVIKHRPECKVPDEATTVEVTTSEGVGEPEAQ